MFYFQYESPLLAVLLYAVGVAEYNLASVKVILILMTDCIESAFCEILYTFNTGFPCILESLPSVFKALKVLENRFGA